MQFTCSWGSVCDERFIFAFPFLFVGIWLLAMWMLAAAGGWTTLAEKYAIPDRMPEGSLRRWQSGVLKKHIPANYSNCMNISITPDGLGLAMMWFFSFRHAAIFIPWDDIDTREEKRRYFRKLDLAVRDTGVRVSFWGPKLIDDIIETHKQYHATRRR